jgi:hypothetical protein
MKSNVKNALNALVLLGFMALAWATSKDPIVEPINMEIKINADSTAFFLKNLDNIDYVKGRVTIQVDSAQNGISFSLDSNLNVKAKSIDTLLFSRFKHGIGGTSFSKRRKLKTFIYSVFPHPAKKDAEGVFEFNF